MIPRDTSPEAAEAQLEALRRLGPAGRFALAIEMSEAVRAASEAGIRRRHPEYTDEQVRKTLLRNLYGSDAPP